MDIALQPATQPRTALIDLIVAQLPREFRSVLRQAVRMRFQHCGSEQISFCQFQEAKSELLEYMDRVRAPHFGDGLRLAAQAEFKAFDDAEQLWLYHSDLLATRGSAPVYRLLQNTPVNRSSTSVPATAPHTSAKDAHSTRTPIAHLPQGWRNPPQISVDYNLPGFTGRQLWKSYTDAALQATPDPRTGIRTFMRGDHQVQMFDRHLGGNRPVTWYMDPASIERFVGELNDVLRAEKEEHEAQARTQRQQRSMRHGADFKIMRNPRVLGHTGGKSYPKQSLAQLDAQRGPQHYLSDAQVRERLPEAALAAHATLWDTLSTMHHGFIHLDGDIDITHKGVTVNMIRKEGAQQLNTHSLKAYKQLLSKQLGYRLSSREGSGNTQETQR